MKILKAKISKNTGGDIQIFLENSALDEGEHQAVVVLDATENFVENIKLLLEDPPPSRSGQIFGTHSVF